MALQRFNTSRRQMHEEFEHPLPRLGGQCSVATIGTHGRYAIGP